MIKVPPTIVRVPYFRDIPEPSCRIEDDTPTHIIIDYIECISTKFENGRFVIPEHILKHVEDRRFKYVGHSDK